MNNLELAGIKSEVKKWIDQLTKYNLIVIDAELPTHDVAGPLQPVPANQQSPRARLDHSTANRDFTNRGEFCHDDNTADADQGSMAMCDPEYFGTSG